MDLHRQIGEDAGQFASAGRAGRPLDSGEQGNLPMHRLLWLALWLGPALAVAPPVQAQQVLRLAAPPGVVDSGVLRHLNPIFEQQHNARVEVTVAATAKALQLGSAGEVDVLLMHAPAEEKRFMADGDGIDQRPVMHADFVIVGPEADPAKVREAKDAAVAFRRIAEARSEFVACAQATAAGAKEREVWELAGLKPAGRWYQKTGQGAAAVLQIADQKQAYALADRGTYLSYRTKLDLPVLLQGDPVLLDPYHVIAVNSARHQGVSIALARKYIEFLTGVEAQKLIGEFRFAGKPLFVPDAAKRP